MGDPPVSGAVFGDKGIRYQGHREESLGRCLAGRGYWRSSFAIACCNRFPILPAAITVSSLRRCSEIPSLRPCCRILRIFVMKCRSSNPGRDLHAARRFIRVFAPFSCPAIFARGGRGSCFRRGVDHDWLACTTGGVPPALWARAGAKGPVESGGKTCRAWLRTPPLYPSAAILARSGWGRKFEPTTQHTGMRAAPTWRPRRAQEIAEASSNPMD